jgi:hypothetical protein
LQLYTGGAFLFLKFSKGKKKREKEIEEGEEEGTSSAWL